MSVPLRVLIVEDNADDAELLARKLRRGGYHPTFERVETSEAMGAALRQAWDVVISDWSMPHFSARAALALVQSAKLDLPFLIVSGTVGEEVAVEAMRAGAHDFMVKGQFMRLIPAIEREMREAKTRAGRRAIEQQLLQAQKMEAIGNLTGGMAHDFNNLLGVIIGNLDLLRELRKEDTEADELAREALEAAIRGADLTRRLLAFARRQPLQPQQIDLNELVAGIVTLLRRVIGEDVAIALDTGQGTWPVIVDPAQLQASITNLANNARDAMPRGGRLTIVIGNRQLDEHYAAMHPDLTAGDYAMIEVSDTGTGMTQDIMNRIFEPFYTTKEQGKGTGLGLSMVYGFIKQSGGHINVYSEPGVGTTFRLYLPRGGAAVIADRAFVEEAVPSGEGETVLVVEDNAGMRRVVRRQLTELGYQVFEVETAMQALDLLERERVDLVFSDVVLPGELNGLELARIAKDRWPHLRTILTSGFPAKPCGSVDVGGPLLIKPYRKADLARALRDSLRG